MFAISRAFLLVSAVAAAVGVADRSNAAQGQNVPGIIRAAPGASTPGVIEGRVTAADTGLPLRGAAVRLQGPSLSPAGVTVATDETGAYAFDDLATGRFTLTASKSGYVTMGFGQPRVDSAPVPIDLERSITIKDVNFQLPAGGVVVVSVNDDFGAPVSNVEVVLEVEGFVDGQKQMRRIDSEVTDDKGEARIAGLAPRSYVISARNFILGRGGVPVLDRSDSQRQFAAGTYYPDATELGQAQRITVGPNEERRLSIALVPQQGATITGQVRGPSGEPVQPALTLTRLFGAVNGQGRAVTVRPDGSFDVPNVLPGLYRFTVGATQQQNAARATSLHGSLSVAMTGADLTGIVIRTVQGATARGRIVFEGDAPADLRPPALQLTLAGAASNGRSLVSPDWTFELTNVSGPGLLRLRSASAGWYVHSVMLNGQDVTDQAIDFARTPANAVDDLRLQLTRTGATISGVIRRDRKPAAGYAVVLFPPDEARWLLGSRFIRTGQSDNDGRFTIPALPPGRYVAVAVEDLAAGEEYDTALLAKLLPAGKPVAVAGTESQTIDLDYAVR